MRKILFIFLLFPILASAQLPQTFRASDVTGTDTTIYLKPGNKCSITFDFTEVNSTTDSIDLGVSDDKLSYQSLTQINNSITNPFALNKTTYTKTVAGVTKNRVAYTSTKPALGFYYWAFTWHTNGVKTGKLRVY